MSSFVLQQEGACAKTEPRMTAKPGALAAHRVPPLPSPPIHIEFFVAPHLAPALKSAVDEISNLIGTRLEGPSKFAKEDALTRAAIALGLLRAAITEQVPRGDRDYV